MSNGYRPVLSERESKSIHYCYKFFRLIRVHSPWFFFCDEMDMDEDAFASNLTDFRQR
jgi:hypothetical protein